MFQTPRYQATVFPGLGCTLDAVTEDGKIHTIAGVGVADDWNVNRCRGYAIEGGFTVETVRQIDGLTVFHWTEPPAPLAALRHHVTGAVERGEAVPVVCQPV